MGLEFITSIIEAMPHGAGDRKDFYTLVALLEVELLEWALTRTRGNQVRAAQLLTLSYRQLRHLIKKYELQPRAFRPGVVR